MTIGSINHTKLNGAIAACSAQSRFLMAPCNRIACITGRPVPISFQHILRTQTARVMRPDCLKKMRTSVSFPAKRCSDQIARRRHGNAPFFLNIMKRLLSTRASSVFIGVCEVGIRKIKMGPLEWTGESCVSKKKPSISNGNGYPTWVAEESGCAML